MNSLFHKQSYLSMFIVILILTYTVCWHTHAQDNTSSISGHVVNSEGDPVAGIDIAIKPVILQGGYERGLREPFSSWSKTTTDKDGTFKLTEISPGTSRIVILPELGSPYEIQSIKIGDITVHTTAFRANHPTWFGKPTFSIDPGQTVENVIVNVQDARMRISGRVLIDDGTPLTNTEINLTVYHRDRDTFLFFFSSGGSGGSSGRMVTTDAQGYFVSYAPDDEEEYCVSVIYKGVFAKSTWFRLKKGQRKDNLKIQLRGIKEKIKQQEERQKSKLDMWSVNPNNKHAYKKIECNSWGDAKMKAKAENAYLLIVNNQEEQKWIEARFTQKTFFWIGLKAPEDGQPWMWNDGSVVEYTNWHQLDIPITVFKSNLDIPIALLYANKKWFPIKEKSPFEPFVKYAIIEKDEYK